MTYGRLAQLVEHLLDVQEVTGSSPVPSTTSPDHSVWGFFCGGRYRTRTARAERSEGNQSPGGALISARFPTRRNVYRDAGTVWGFFCGGRYRTRTARAERSEGNQSPGGALVSARFPTARNVYRDDYRFVVDGTGLEQQRQPLRNSKFHSTGGYSSIGKYGILGLVQQIGIYKGEY